MPVDWESKFDLGDSDDDEENKIPEVDYYKILGVSKQSSEKEIKKSYRQKARELHPDKHLKEKETYKKSFQELCEAYGVLSDKKKRQIYDKYGARGLQNNNFLIPKNKTELNMLFKMVFDDDDDDKHKKRHKKKNKNERLSSRSDSGVKKCSPIEVKKIITKREYFNGAEIVVSFKKRIACTSCANDKKPKCPVCDGRGSIQDSLPSIGQKVCLYCVGGYQKEHCHVCQGTCCSSCTNNGFVIGNRKCSYCDGKGKTKDWTWSKFGRKSHPCDVCDGKGTFCRWCQDKGYTKIDCNAHTHTKNINSKKQEVLKGRGNEKANFKNGDVIVTYHITS